jgi:hypothetical protein
VRSVALMTERFSDQVTVPDLVELPIMSAVMWPATRA